MLPLIAGALISGGASILGNLLNKNSVQQTNQQQQDFNTQMYNKQRADALADWERQNQYNSPSQQMQRFKEAGLNPNLIYGQMSNAPAVRSTDMKAPDFVAPKYDTSKIGDILGNYLNLQKQQVDISNDKKAGALLDQQIEGKKLENENLRDQSPWILESKMNQARLAGMQINNIMADIRNKEVINPLQQDEIRNRIQTMTQTRMWQNLTTPQQLAVSKATSDLLNLKLTGQDIQNKMADYEQKLQSNFGINKTTFSDLIKIVIHSLFK